MLALHEMPKIDDGDRKQQPLPSQQVQSTNPPTPGGYYVPKSPSTFDGHQNPNHAAYYLPSDMHDPNRRPSYAQQAHGAVGHLNSTSPSSRSPSVSGPLGALPTTSAAQAPITTTTSQIPNLASVLPPQPAYPPLYTSQPSMVQPHQAPAGSYTTSDPSMASLSAQPHPTLVAPPLPPPQMLVPVQGYPGGAVGAPGATSMPPPLPLHSGPLAPPGGVVPHPGAAHPSGPPSHLMTTFNSKLSLRSLKKHLCSVCGKRFTRPSSLQTHMYSHTGEKPFKCDFEGCGRHFSVVSNLRRHKKIHGIYP